mgnify:CR=1 FL=1
MAHLAQSPSFILHQVTCQFATGATLFGPLNLSLEPSLCALVGRNGSGKTRLLRLLAGLDEPANGHIERTGTQVYVAQQQDILPHTTLAELLGYEAIFAARARVDSGEYQPDDLETLDGFWDLAERLSEAFARARLPPLIRINLPLNSAVASVSARCCAGRLRRKRIICCWTNPLTTWTGKAGHGSTTSLPVIRAVYWWPPMTVSCWRRCRVFLN